MKRRGQKGEYDSIPEEKVRVGGKKFTKPITKLNLNMHNKLMGQQNSGSRQ